MPRFPLSTFSLFLLAASTGLPATALAQTGGHTVMAVFAHPDDDAYGAAGSVALHADEPGFRFVLVHATFGEQGERTIDRGRMAMLEYDVYHARRAGTRSTGSAVRGYSSTPSIGSHNLYVEPGDKTPEQILASVDRGFYYDDQGSFGWNDVTGLPRGRSLN